MVNHRAEISAQAEAYLEELRAAAAAAHERLASGVLRLLPQAHDDPVPQEPFEDEPLPEVDPIFATREFDMPREALQGLADAGLVDFNADEQTE
jgi:hypothetical protein